MYCPAIVVVGHLVVVSECQDEAVHGPLQHRRGALIVSPLVHDVADQQRRAEKGQYSSVNGCTKHRHVPCMH